MVPFRENRSHLYLTIGHTRDFGPHREVQHLCTLREEDVCIQESRNGISGFLSHCACRLAGVWKAKSFSARKKVVKWSRTHVFHATECTYTWKGRSCLRIHYTWTWKKKNTTKTPHVVFVNNFAREWIHHRACLECLGPWSALLWSSALPKKNTEKKDRKEKLVCNTRVDK